MPALVSSRLLFLVSESVSFGSLSHVCRSACFRSDVRFLSRFRPHNGPLTLASLGFRSELESVKENQVTRDNPRDSPADIALQQLNPPVQNGLQQFSTPLEDEHDHSVSLPKDAKIKPKIVRGKEVGKRKPLEIEAAPFAAESFSELGLPPFLLQRLEQEGFTKPTDVQSSAVPTILKGHDAVIQSYTGSGKTLAYLLPILSEVGPLKKSQSSAPRREVEAVIVAPSRELGMQIVREVEKLLGPDDKRMVQQLVGGANKTRQEEALKKNKPAIVVGTPGRIAEISASGKLHTHGCQFLVLDEVDELLAFNFREDMHRILEHVGRKSGAGPASGRRTIMVSATVPFSVMRAAQSWCRDPVLVRAKSVGPLESISVPAPSRVNLPGSNEIEAPSQAAASESMPPLLKHYYCITNLQHKVDTLRRCVHALDAKSVIAFMNQNKQLKDTVFKLEARGMKAAELHGDLNKLARSSVLKKFRSGEIRVLVTNELAARGLDVTECDLVVNLGLPTDSIHYAHRAGRTGRLGRKGVVVTVCEEREVFVVRKLQKQLGIAIQPCDFLEGRLVKKEEQD
ncbi:hypothetical protein RND81_06G058200 [Saponaria officinalis]|uniref:RNA helicase n=1 Tax=Saponaria officinalis TaxID=3572 RepID=A0AAW1K774_SAPOF